MSNQLNWKARLNYPLVNGQIKVTKRDGTTADALEAILAVTETCSQDPIAKELAAQLDTGVDFYRNLYNFAYKHAYYEPNPPKHQRIRTLQRTLHDAKASCVDYSILVGAVILASGRPVNLKLVSINGNSYGHIFPVTDDGTIMDVVYGQDESGNEFYTRQAGSVGRFNETCPFKKQINNFLYPMENTILNGTSTINGDDELNGTSTINCTKPTGTRHMVEGRRMIALNGVWIDDEINGTVLQTVEEYDDEINGTSTIGSVTDEEYQDYVLAVALGDPEANSVNGLKDWLNKRKEKRADKKDAKATKKADRKANKKDRVANRQSFFKNVGDLVKAKAGSLNADASSVMKDLESRGIDADPDLVADAMYRNAGGGGDDDKKSSNMPLILGGLGLAAVLLMKK